MDGMPAGSGAPAYPFELLRDTARWSVPVAAAIAIAGTVVTRDIRFGASCAIGAAFDIGTLAWMLRPRAGEVPFGAVASRRLPLWIAGRLLAKALLLVGAVTLPAYLDLWGMGAGVLSVDLTLATAGSAMAAWRMFRPGGLAGRTQ